MPSYDYHCNHCGRHIVLAYKTYKDYDAATHTCPYCGSEDLTRLISRVSVARPSRDMANMSSQEMLSVMEGGDSREMGELFKQVSDTVPDGVDSQFNQVADRLLKGDKPEHVEADLRAESESKSKKSTDSAPSTD